MKNSERRIEVIVKMQKKKEKRLGVLSGIMVDVYEELKLGPSREGGRVGVYEEL